MKIAEKEVILRDGRRILLRSPGAADAGQMLENMRVTSGETYFMARYPEEIVRPLEMQSRILEEICADEEDFLVGAFFEEKMVGCAGLNKVSEHIKNRHRGGFGISIRQQFCDAGLGTLMLQEVLQTARKTHFEQIELGVFEDNPRAIHLYEKCGFVPWGRQPRAFKLKDGTYRDEIQMILIL